MTRESSQHGGSGRLAVVGTAAVLLLIAVESPRALPFLALDGVPAALILCAAALAGLWLVALFRLPDLPLRWHLLLGAGLGIGALASLVLALGLAGWLNRVVWAALLMGAGLAGGVRFIQMLLRDAASHGPASPPTAIQDRATPGGLDRGMVQTRSTALGPSLRRVPGSCHPPQKSAVLWLVVCPFAALALLVALVPPGWLWSEEGNGYDVLEYHLQMPREYLEAGHIGYAPHNVYANFPANAEMLYLLAMIVQGGPLAGTGTAQLMNALLAFLTVAAAWLAGRETSPAAGVGAGVLAATTGWLTYLSGVAYVENAMLFFAMLSAAVLVRASSEGCTAPRRWIMPAGVLAGFSAGCKYTALPLVVLPLALAVLLGRWASWRARLSALGLFVLSAVAAFAPWLLKNVAFTGNPVFPLAGNVFRSHPEGWSGECAEHFARSHAPGPEEASVGARIGSLWSKVLADPLQRFGPAVFLLAGAGLAARPRRRLEWQFTLVLVSQVVLWLGFTHLYARFAVVFLVPLVILGGRFLADLKTPAAKTSLALLLVGAVWNLVFLGRLYHDHLHPDTGRISIEGTPAVFTEGLMPSYEHLAVINGELPAEAKLLLVGEARAFYFLRKVDYCVVFNSSSFIEAMAAAKAPGEMGSWLRSRNYTQVYIGWSEIERLRRSRYGFPQAVTPARFEELVSAGILRRRQAFPSGGGRGYAELYDVEPVSPPSSPDQLP